MKAQHRVENPARHPAATSGSAVDADGKAPHVTAVTAATLEDVSFTYSEAHGRALSNVHFRLRPGEMVGIMGASCAGKSTIAKCLNRIVPAFEGGDFRGVVRISGRAVGSDRVCDLASMVGMVFQDFEAQLFSTNVAHEVAFAMEQVGMRREEIAARIQPALKAVGLEGFDDRDPTSLSGGEKQRLAIAAVLALRPGVIVLDEPTTDLDPEGRAEIFALIRRLREQGLSLIVIEHEAEELRGCDRIVILREGELIAEGRPAEIMTRVALLEECGVHPPSLNRILGALGIDAHANTINEAEVLIRAAFPQLPSAPAAPHDGDARELPPPLYSSGATSSEASRPGSSLAPPSRAPATTPSSTHTMTLSHASSTSPSHVLPTTPASTAAATPAAVPQVDRVLVDVRDVSFAYPRGPRVLRSVNFKIAAGEFLAIIGQNGSGKTTLAKHLMGLLKPSEGQILLEGRDRTSLRPSETAQEVGYVFQNPDHQIFAATVEAEVAFGPRNFGLPQKEIERRCEEVLRAVNLTAARTRDPFLLGKGERQRLAVASVLALRPRLLILDEPTTGLDYREQLRMMALVSELNRDGIAIVMITHTPWLVAEYARRVVLMRRGRIMFDGGVCEFLAQDELLASSSFRPPEAVTLGRRFGITALRPNDVVEWVRQVTGVTR